MKKNLKAGHAPLSEGIADKALFSKASRQKAKIEVIVRTAARLIYEKGVAETSLDDVANELGIAKPSLYYYVKSKEELLFLCNRRIFDLKDEAIAAAESSGKNGAEMLELFLRALVRIVMDPESGMPRLWQAGPHSILAGERRRAIDRINEAQSKRIRAIIQRGIKDGSLRVDDPAIMEAALVGAIYWIPMSHYFDANADVEELADGYIGMFFNGVRSRGASGKGRSGG